eukprot:COSAG01_NODE_808_length_13418_cov_9.469631_11_plen_125_part_00
MDQALVWLRRRALHSVEIVSGPATHNDSLITPDHRLCWAVEADTARAYSAQVAALEQEVGLLQRCVVAETVEVTDTRAQQRLGRRQHGVECDDSAGQMMLPSLARHCCCHYSDACLCCGAARGR